MKNKVILKQIEPILVVKVEGDGNIQDFDRDLNKLYEYLFSHKLQNQIAGPAIGLFYTELGGKYVVAIPMKKTVTLDDSMKMDTLPSISCTSVLHTKGSETIEESFNLMKEYRKRHNIKWLFPVREIYVPSQNNKGKYNIEIQVPTV